MALNFRNFVERQVRLLNEVLDELPDDRPPPEEPEDEEPTVVEPLVIKKVSIKSVRYPKVPEGEVDFDELSHTELVNMAHYCGIHGACRGTPREVLIQSLSTLEQVEEENPFLDLRELLNRWLTYYWPQFMQAVGTKALPPGLKQPKDILDCRKISDFEVVGLWAKNAHQITVE